MTAQHEPNLPPTLTLRTTPAAVPGDPFPVIAGVAPFTVRFNLCQSDDPNREPDDKPTAGEGDSLNWQFHFGDGASEPFNADGTFNPDFEHFCRVEHTYEGGNYTATVSVTDKHLEDQSRDVSAQARVTERLSIVVSGFPASCANDTTGPSVALTSPSNNQNFFYFPIPFRATASDASGIASVRYLVRGDIYGPPNFTAIGSSSSAPAFPFDWSQAAATAAVGQCCATLQAKAIATDSCGNTGESAAISFSFSSFAARVASAATLGWSSEISVPSSQGQVVLNGGDVSFPQSGQSWGMGEARAGVNTIEAQLVRGSGEAGTWSFEFAPDGAVEPGSLGVISGELERSTPHSVTFRLKGQPGERVVFNFRASK